MIKSYTLIFYLFPMIFNFFPMSTSYLDQLLKSLALKYWFIVLYNQLIKIVLVISFSYLNYKI